MPWSWSSSKEAILTEELAVAAGYLEGVGILAVNKFLRDQPGEAGTHANEPLSVSLEKLMINPGFIVEALGVAEGGQLEKVVIAGTVAGEEDEMVVASARFAARRSFNGAPLVP